MSVKWKKAKIGGQPRTFKDIKSVGWVNEDIKFGKLLNIRDETNRVVFEFYHKGRFDATSSLNNNGLENKTKLKKGFSYVLNGAIRVEYKSTKKYDRGSSSTSRFKAVLGSIDVVQEIREVSRNNSRIIGDRLRDLKTAQESGKYFTQKVNNIKIVSGEIYRYLGCEKCFTGIPWPDAKDKKFYCTQCLKKSGPKIRRMCTIIRSLQVQDPQDEDGILNCLVMYHHEIEKLVGVQLMADICESFTDHKARSEFQNKIVGCTINANIVYQRPTGSTTKRHNWAKLIIKEIELVAWPVPRTSQEPVPGPSTFNSHMNNAGETVEDESESDEDDGFDLLPISNIKGVSGNHSDPSDERQIMPRLENDKISAGAYKLTKSANGFFGLVLVININSNINQDKRRGSELDVSALTQVFPMLKMKIFRNEAIVNPNTQMFQQILLEFKAELIRENYSCFFLAFMGHGQQNTVTLAEGPKLDRINVYTDIMCQFSEEKFSFFTGRPKIFIFQSCQEALAGQEGFTVSAEAPMSDFLWITPCLPGQRAKRSTKKGCYFIQTLAYCLYKYREHSLRDIICEVSKKLMKYRKRNKGFFTPTDSGRGFRSFFFPPDVE